jgi:NAD(P)-dependent dehydrogenase (short-subunit alcohol dehydrogenase family)
MRDRTSGPVAIVTGAGSGIGAAVAQRLAADGWRLVLTGRRPEPLLAIAETIEAEVLPGDVRSDAHASALIETAIGTYGRLDGLVLNAGMTLAGRVDQTSPEQWQLMLDTNLTGPFLLCRAALDQLRSDRGAIVAVASIAASVAGPELAAYGVAKAGLLRLMQSIAVDFGPAGVRANTVNPGWIRTEMADAEMEALIGRHGADLAEVYELATCHVPARRPGSADEAAAAVAWLLSADASYVNGAVVNVDGGTAIVDAGMLAFDDR